VNERATNERLASEQDRQMHGRGPGWFDGPRNGILFLRNGDAFAI
jgi:hypothetical protein